MAFLANSQSPEAGEGGPAPHPLAPLAAAEIETATAAIKAARNLTSDARFVYVWLYEPAKSEVVAFEAGERPAPDRLVKVVIRERAERATYEGAVALPGGDIRAWRQVPGVQPAVMFEEFAEAEEAVREDPRWQEAMRKRGVTDFDLCMIDPWSSPNVAPGLGPADGRFVRPLTWVRDAPDDNGYARPVEGVVTLVDLDTMTVVEVEDHGVVPLPSTPANYSPAAITDPANLPSFPNGPRNDVKPLDITQSEGFRAGRHGPHQRHRLHRRRLPVHPRPGRRHDRAGERQECVRAAA
jgi:primary-amine oxidase